MDNNDYKLATESIVNAIKYMIDEQLSHVTQIYNGVIISNSTRSADVTVNGKSYTLPKYGTISYSKGDVVKVFVPQGNMNLAFFM